MNIGRALKLTRVRADLTLEQLEELTGVSKSTLSQYENNKNAIKLDRAYKIVKACGGDWSEFIGGLE